MIWAVIWYYLLVLFSIADIITTRMDIALGFYEGNPIMSPYIDSIVEMKVLLLLVIAASIIVLEVLSKKYWWLPEGWVPVSIGTTFTFCIVIQNILRGAIFG